MAKGDHAAAQSQINQDRNKMAPQYQGATDTMQSNYGNQQNNSNQMMGQQNNAINSWQPSYSFAGGGHAYGGWTPPGQNAPQNNNNGSPNGGNSQPFDMGNFQSGWMNQFGGKPVSADDIRNYVTTNAPGATSLNSKGDKWKLPSGQTVDMGNSMGTGSGTGQFLLDDGTGGGGGGQYGFAPQMDLSFLNNAMSGVRPYYQNLADTGGYSEADKANLRERNLAPTRSMYSNAQDEMQRHLALSNGGSGVNYNAAVGKMNRDMQGSLTDTNTATNAGIAQMVQQGKQAGMGGLNSIDQALMSARMGGNQSNLAAQLQGMQTQSEQEIAANQNQIAKLGLGNQLAGLGAGQANNAMQGYLGSLGQQGNYGLGMVGAQINASQIPSNFQQAMGNIGSVVGLGSQAAGAMGGMGGYGGAPLTSRQTVMPMGGYAPNIYGIGGYSLS